MTANTLEVAVETWNLDDGKGIDELLLAGIEPQVVAGDELQQLLEAVATVAATAADENGGSLEADDDPDRLARLYLSQESKIRYWREEFYRWQSPHYELFPDDELRAAVHRVVKSEFDRIAAKKAQSSDGDTPAKKAKKVTRNLVTNVIEAIKAETILPCTTEQPSWLCNSNGHPAERCLVTPNGILPVDSLNSQPVLIEPTPEFFAVNGIDFEFDPNALCPQWDAFLAELWPDDRESIDTLQEIFGYLLLPDTKQEKFFMLIGPKRSGKGTIGRVLRGIIGPKNYVAPTLGSLAGEFGLQPLLGKTVAVIGDARLSGRTDSAAVVERILSITGEDSQTVNRKHRTAVTTTLLARFVLLSNELPRLNDASATFPSRAIVLQLRKSFYGHEDDSLTERLLTERSGILRWALTGWQRLHFRGHFVQPERSRELLDDLETLSSPVIAFVRDRCVIEVGRQTPIQAVFGVWKEWCESKGRKPGSEQVFGRDLRAAVPSVNVTQPRDEHSGKQIRHYDGLGLLPSDTQ